MPQRGCVSPRAVDGLLAAAVAVAMTLTIAVAQEAGPRPPDVLAYLMGLMVAVLLLARRRQPLLVLIGSVGVLFVYYALDYPAFSPAVPLAAAAYSAAAAGAIVGAAGIVAVLVIAGAGWQSMGEGESLLSVLGRSTLADAALLAAVLLLGEAVRSRRAWAKEVRQRLRRADEEREREAARRVEEERLRIARELHDVMAHTVAAITVQAGVAADVLDDEPDQALASLRTIREQGREAMAELKATVAVLRDGSADLRHPSVPGLAGLDALVQVATGAGLRVEVSVSGAARPLPGAVDLTAYRIVQESLTNVVRHAHASAANVVVRYEPSAIVVQIEDDGHGGRNGARSDGHGLVGMRERATAVGGTLEAGPAPHGGFRVHARLPTPSTAG